MTYEFNTQIQCGSQVLDHKGGGGVPGTMLQKSSNACHGRNHILTENTCYDEGRS